MDPVYDAAAEAAMRTNKTTIEIMDQVLNLLRLQARAMSEHVIDPNTDNRAKTERELFEAHKKLMRDVYALAKRAV